MEGCTRNHDIYTKTSCELSVVGYNRTYEQCREKIKKLKAEYKKISDKRKETGQGRYPEWDYYDAMDEVLGYKPSTQPAVVIDTLEDSQVQDAPMEDDEWQQTEVGAIPNVDTSSSIDTTGTAVPSPANTDAIDAMATTSHKQKKSTNTTSDKISSRKRKKSKVDDLLDKLIVMQESSDKMLMELEPGWRRSRWKWTFRSEEKKENFSFK